MPISFKYIIYLCAVPLLLACNLEKEIEIEIPDFENGYVVESYLSPDKPFGMLITKSYGFFEIFDVADFGSEEFRDFLVQGVDGYIEVNGERYPLVNSLEIDTISASFYNYLLDRKVKFNADDKIELSLTFPTGEKVEAITRIPKKRPVDSVRIDIDKTQDLEARETTFLSSDSTVVEYFRRQLFRIHDGEKTELQDYLIDNSIAKGGRMAFGSGYEFAVGDTLISRMTHIEKAYNDFFLSATGSVSANTGPFSQPGRIASNIRGSERVIGIFTGINQSEIFMKIE